MQKRPLSFDRHDRATSLIKEVVALYISREANTNPMITVTNTTISPDYRRVTIFFTTIPDGREQDALIFLNRHAGEIRHFLKQKTRLKIIPHLDFAVDYGERHRQDIDEIVRAQNIESTLPQENQTKE
jgi:ribosome-binding factor A